MLSASGDAPMGDDLKSFSLIGNLTADVHQKFLSFMER